MKFKASIVTGFIIDKVVRNARSGCPCFCVNCISVYTYLYSRSKYIKHTNVRRVIVSIYEIAGDLHTTVTEIEEALNLLNRYGYVRTQGKYLERTRFELDEWR